MQFCSKIVDNSPKLSFILWKKSMILLVFKVISCQWQEISYCYTFFQIFYSISRGGKKRNVVNNLWSLCLIEIFPKDTPHSAFQLPFTENDQSKITFPALSWLKTPRQVRDRGQNTSIEGCLPRCFLNSINKLKLFKMEALQLRVATTLLSQTHWNGKIKDQQ